MYRRLFLSLLACGVVRAQATGSISGVVTDSSGQPVAAIFVTATKSVMPQDGTPLSSGVLTDASGAFSFKGLNEATYRLCMSADSRRGFVSSCEWDLKPPAITLTEGQTAADVKLTVERGTRLEFEIVDPKDSIATLGSTNGKKRLELGVWGSHGLFLPAKLEKSQGSSKHYVVVIPASQQFQIHARGENLVVKAENGVALGTTRVRPRESTIAGEPKRSIKLSVE